MHVIPLQLSRIFIILFPIFKNEESGEFSFCMKQQKIVA